jgi:uncharacterized delta-60 repeat protein
LDGKLDPTFGLNGSVFPLNLTLTPYAVVIQPDGRIVVGGWILRSFGVVRFNHDGSLDSTFGNNGVVTIRFVPGATDDRIFELALQSDGKIVAAGEVDTAKWFALARFNPDGSLDTSFGDGGKVMPGMSPGLERAQAVAIQSDSKIVAVGEVDDSPTIAFAIARFNSNGELDPTFGTGGRVFTDFGGLATGTSMAIQPDGQILAGGFTRNGGNPNQQFALARYQTDGTLDPTFDSDGKVITGFSGNAICFGMVLQSDGRIVAAGGLTNPAGGKDFVLTRYNSNGALDNTFGNLGTVITDFGGSDFAFTVVLQPDDKIVAAGQYTNFSDGSGDFALARYLTTPTNSPVLQTEANSTQAVALDSVTLVRDPFPVTSDYNFSADHQTRIILLATNLTLSSGEIFSSVSVKAEAAGGAIQTLPVEYVGTVPGFEWLTQVVVRLPAQLANAGTMQVSITHGNTSNQGSIVIK